MLHSQGTRKAHRYDNGNTSRRGRGGSKTTELRSEEVEPAGVESGASGKDQVNVWSKGSDSKSVNVQVGCGESKDADEELYIFPQCAPAPAPAATPTGRAALLPSLTPAGTSEGRAASPAPLTTADVSGGRATPATVVSVNVGSGFAEFEGSGVSSSPRVSREGSDRVLNEDTQESPVPSTRGAETGEATPPPVLGGREAARLKWTAEDPVPSTRGAETGEATPPPVLGGREAARLKWTAEGPTRTVEGRMRGDVRRLQALHDTALIAREMGMEAAILFFLWLMVHM